jgi:hypothetical protein
VRPPRLAGRAVAVATAVLLLAGCGAARPGGAPTREMACPVQGDGAALPDGCAPYDGNAAMRENERYRDRRPLPPSATDAAQPDLQRIRRALEPVAARSAPTEADLRAALLALGFAAVDVQTMRLGFGVETHGGCVYGGIRSSTVEIAFGGFIEDGGCLPADGH